MKLKVIQNSQNNYFVSFLIIAKNNKSNKYNVS